MRWLSLSLSPTLVHRCTDVVRTLALLACAGSAAALQVTSFAPQGTQSRIREAVVRFDRDAVTLGDAKAPAPFELQCDEASASQGQGRWNSAREWVHAFQADLPPGVHCTARPSAWLKSSAGRSAASLKSYAFNSGGPFVQSLQPSTDAVIEEDQAFLLRLNGNATPASVQANVWCSLDGLGERIPVRLLEGETRTALLKTLDLEREASQQPQRFHAVSCQRRLTPGARMQLIYGAGVATPSGVTHGTERRYSFEVRKPFSIELSCERENAQADCMPIRPIRVQFSSPVPRRQAEQLRLRGPHGELRPKLDSDGDELVDNLQFEAPLPERTRFSVSLPADLKDASGRALAPTGKAPPTIATGGMPPLVKFAAAPFGIVERFAEGPDSTPLLPLTLRNVEPQLKIGALSSGQVRQLQAGSDADIIAWYQRVQRYDARWVARDQAAKELRQPLPKAVDKDQADQVESRTLSLLAGQPGVQTLDLPRPASGDLRPFEVVGVPLTPGFHVIEVASPRLGQALLDARQGPSRTLYVRTAALVTNLGVHVKLGRENALAWVTTLDQGKPVAGAAVRVSDCKGKPLAQATTDAQGIARFNNLPPQAPTCAITPEDDAFGAESPGYFVSARAQDHGVEDMAFTWTSWQRGIEPWRFNVPTSRETQPDQRTHTVFDRTLLRAGETVSMKHFVRAETSAGFALPKQLPDTLVITHVGSGQEYTQPLTWRTTATGGRSAESSFSLPAAARLGVYQVVLRYAGDDLLSRGISGSFRVEEFRLPVFQGRIAPVAPAALVAASQLPVQVQLNYLSGGPAASLPVRVSALLRQRTLAFPDYEGFAFTPPARSEPGADTGAAGEEESSARDDQKVVADKLPLTLDRMGQGKLTLDQLPPVRQPQELILEAQYADPNGEIQTLQGRAPLWPAAVVAGLRTEGWVSTSQAVKLQALALDLAGKPQAGVPLDVKAIARITTSSRKRMVGGFYTYDNRTETRDLGTVCAGTSDARGLLACEARLTQPGQIELVVTARDAQGRSAQAAHSVWVTHQGELWFGSDNHDRMDVVAEKKLYQPGETARFQVRMPFRYATALVAVEREGILQTQLVELRGDDPTITLKVDQTWAPNVYVSVLALRGRLREVPWYSFFTWGYKAPAQWWRAFWDERTDYVAPTALVDLSKPAFRLGMAEIRVDARQHQLDVSVQADQERYTVRGKARLTIRARLPNGQPAAHAEVALAAVDQALLELMPNPSWAVLDAMLARRSWGVETSTAQMEIIGRRHYGRKAVPTGGDGGGKSPTRELLDTLLLWNPRVLLDAQGQATVELPLNDALTSFRIAAVADHGVARFGHGETTIRTTQDLQLISGLPPLVREGDAFRAQLTVRNTTAKAMKVQLTPRASLLQPEPKTLELPAGEAREVAWDVTAPAQLAFTRAESLIWEIEAKDQIGGARDALKITQRIVPAVPVTVQQSTLLQLDQPYHADAAPPAGALPADPAQPDGARRGGLKLSLQPRLSEGLPGVRDWFAHYPYACLEQRTSKSIGLRDEKLWARTVAEMPAYLDANGLAAYFPPRAGMTEAGSDTLTAWLLTTTHEAAQLNPAFALPDAPRARMLDALTQFVEGKLERKHWSPRNDLDERKLAAIEALARHGRATPAMLSSLTVAPSQWPTSAVLDWINILRRVPGVPDQAARLKQADQVLRTRLSYQGTRLVFSSERDDAWWWLMAGGDLNAARLMLTVLNDPAWKAELPRLALGTLARQQRGAWNTTTANLWGSLAMERFSKQFEAAPITGRTRATLGEASASVDWAKVTRLQPQATAVASTESGFGAALLPGQLTGNTLQLPWNPSNAPRPLVVRHDGSGKPWVTVQSLAAVAHDAPVDAGYQIRKTVTPVDAADPKLPAGRYTRGDVLRVTLEVVAAADMTWVVLHDPVPAGATILGSGLGRDSVIATLGEKVGVRDAQPVFEERSFEAYRAYYDHLPKGTTKVEYTVRLNTPGAFNLPPTRVEALYAPEMHGETPNARVLVQPAR